MNTNNILIKTIPLITIEYTTLQKSLKCLHFEKDENGKVLVLKPMTIDPIRKKKS